MNDGTPYAETKAVYDRIAPSYAGRWFSSNLLRDTLAYFIDSTADQKRIADIGCGIGRDVGLMLAKGVDAIGFDVSAGMIAEAKRLVPNGVFRRMDMLDIRMPTDLFDGIWCAATLHHLEPKDQKLAFAQFGALLRNNGLLFVSTNLGRGHAVDDFGRHKYLSEPHEIEAYAKSAGFSVERLETSQSDLHECRESQNWIQLLARKSASQETTKRKSLCFFCEPLLFPTNRQHGLPVVGSVILGNAHWLLAVDAAPMVLGHALLITREHHLSSLSSGSDARNALRAAQQVTNDLYQRAFGADAMFVEHGGAGSTGDGGACIEHAHFHCVPRTDSLCATFARELNQANFRAVHENEIVSAGASAQFLSVEDGLSSPRYYMRDAGVPSQFLRYVISTETKSSEYRWVATAYEAENAMRFRATLNLLNRHCDLMLEAT